MTSDITFAPLFHFGITPQFGTYGVDCSRLALPCVYREYLMSRDFIEVCKVLEDCQETIKCMEPQEASKGFYCDDC